MISVEDIMTPRRDLVTLSPEDNVEKAGRAMAEKRIRHIPLLDTDGRLRGVVSHRDILAATAPKRPGAPTETMGIRLADIMTREVESVDPTLGVRHAGLTLHALNIGCLPVVRDGELLGIVTDSDFVSVAINLLEQLEEIEPLAGD